MSRYRAGVASRLPALAPMDSDLIRGCLHRKRRGACLGGQSGSDYTLVSRFHWKCLLCNGQYCPTRSSANRHSVLGKLLSACFHACRQPGKLADSCQEEASRSGRKHLWLSKKALVAKLRELPPAQTQKGTLRGACLPSERSARQRSGLVRALSPQG